MLDGNPAVEKKNVQQDAALRSHQTEQEKWNHVSSNPPFEEKWVQWGKWKTKAVHRGVLVQEAHSQYVKTVNLTHTYLA